MLAALSTSCVWCVLPANYLCCQPATPPDPAASPACQPRGLPTNPPPARAGVDAARQRRRQAPLPVGPQRCGLVAPLQRARRRPLRLRAAAGGAAAAAWGGAHGESAVVGGRSAEGGRKSADRGQDTASACSLVERCSACHGGTLLPHIPMPACQPTRRLNTWVPHTHSGGGPHHSGGRHLQRLRRARAAH